MPILSFPIWSISLVCKFAFLQAIQSFLCWFWAGWLAQFVHFNFTGFTIILMPILSFLIVERVGGAKHLQKVSGVHPVVFWLSNWLFDFCYLMFISALVLPMFTLAKNPYPDVSGLFIYSCIFFIYSVLQNNSVLFI